jgi:cyclophilin family peptidyl-prolyl cis-trans isomerase
MAMDAAELSKYRVLMETTSGNMMMEFWPDLALGHVRNFLDLSYNPFYAGTVFHRTIPGFMIQGGCPQGNGRGNGPRMLKAEFSDRKHVRGVLSMARSNSPDSASSQFFVCHGDPSFLDGKYTVFGRLVSGLDTLDRIVTAPTNPGGEGSSPVAPVKVTKTTVLLAN